MKVGFTGTKHGMTAAQRKGVDFMLHYFTFEPPPFEFHHGDCVGSDSQAHGIARRCGYVVHVHPPDNDAKRAFRGGQVNYSPKSYLARNWDIVCMTDLLIATPKLMEQRRSGTWATVRYARKLGRRVLIIWPDGAVKDEPAKKQSMLKV